MISIGDGPFKENEGTFFGVHGTYKDLIMDIKFLIVTDRKCFTNDIVIIIITDHEPYIIILKRSFVVKLYSNNICKV